MKPRSYSDFVALYNPVGGQFLELIYVWGGTKSVIDNEHKRLNDYLRKSQVVFQLLMTELVRFKCFYNNTTVMRNKYISFVVCTDIEM